MKVTHTHRGHCQYCLRVIAIDPATGVLAKHGYTVEGGMFQGSCPGSEVLSLHVDRAHTDRVIAMYSEKAATLAERAARLESGKSHPVECIAGRPYYGDTSDEAIMKYWNFEYRTVIVPRINKRTGQSEGREAQEHVTLAWKDANAIQRRRAVLFAIGEAKRGSENAASIASDMTRWAAEVYDAKMPAYRNEDLDEWAKVGDTVYVGGGKTGFEAKVEELAMMDYTTFGCSRGRQTITIQHAQVTRPAVTDTLTKNGKVKKAGKPAKTWFEPVRNLKPPKGSLIDRLKVAGLI